MPNPKAEITKILVVDDNPAVLRLLGTLFEEQGMAVTLAKSAAQAKAALDATRWEFDLVLSDIAMPGETGFDLLSWIKRETSPKRDLPVLLTTAQLPEAENRLKGLAMGAVDYVVRPIDLPELVLRASHAIENFKRVKSLETSLQDSENFALVGRLLAASHHEIKNVATLVSLAADQAVSCFSAGASERGAQALRNLAQASELLTDMSKNVANLLQPEATHVRPVEINGLVRDVVELMRARVNPYRLELKTGPGELWCLAHPLRVKQVLINLVLNASDSIQQLEAETGGAIHVTVEAPAAADGVCRISVRDNGIGFDPPGERRDFKPFQTTRKLRGGQGLGLWLCSSLMKNMGGSLALRSPGVGEGATATLTLKPSTAPEASDLDISQYLADLD
jgi:C4-dicarboxylate-specific signal transduction histidine kinase